MLAGPFSPSFFLFLFFSVHLLRPLPHACRSLLPLSPHNSPTPSALFIMLAGPVSLSAPPPPPAHPTPLHTQKKNEEETRKVLFLAYCLVESGVLRGSDKRMLTYCGVCWRMLAYAGVSSRAARCACCVSAKANFAGPAPHVLRVYVC
jgi:hypothetical protein